MWSGGICFDASLTSRKCSIKLIAPFIKNLSLQIRALLPGLTIKYYKLYFYFCIYSYVLIFIIFYSIDNNCRKKVILN